MVVIGHSHVVAVTSAGQAAGVNVQTIQLKSMQKSSMVENKTISEEFLNYVKSTIQTANSRYLFSCVGGALHTSLGLLNHPIRFDFSIPERPDIPLDDRAQIIPYDAVSATITRRLKFDLFVLSELNRRLDVKVVHFCSPPPVHNEVFIHRTMLARLKDKVAELGVSPASLRLKLWWLESKIMRERCEFEGIEFVPPPSETLDGDYLADGYRKDASHGNVEYGRLLLNKMLSYQ